MLSGWILVYFGKSCPILAQLTNSGNITPWHYEKIPNFMNRSTLTRPFLSLTISQLQPTIRIFFDTAFEYLHKAFLNQQSKS